MSCMGHMGKEGYKEWRAMKREQQIDRGEIQDTSHYKRTDTDGYKGNNENFGARYATGDPTLAASADGRSADGKMIKKSQKPRGRDFNEMSKASIEAHQAEMTKKHVDRYSNAHWVQEAELTNAGKREDIYRRKIRDARSPDPERFVPQVEQFTRSRAPRDVDNHLFSGKVHREAESEQEMIARKFANNEISLDGAAGHRATEALKDEMDNMRRMRSSTWKDSAMATESNSEVPL